MKTSFKAFTYECDGYDITQGDNEGAKWIRKKLAECRNKAIAYLSKKERTKYYAITGFNMEDTPEDREDAPVWIPVAYTDEEIQRISTLLIDCYNKDADKKIPYDTDIFDLCKDMPLHETEGFSPELDELIHKRVEGHNMEPYGLSLDEHYFYRFTVYFYHREDGTLLLKEKFKVPLTDGEYLELMSQRLLLGNQFSYNRLVLTHPRIAQQLTERILSWSFHKTQSSHPMFVIHFTEIEEDAQAIEAGQEGEQ